MNVYQQKLQKMRDAGRCGNEIGFVMLAMTSGIAYTTCRRAYDVGIDDQTFNRTCFRVVN